MSTQAAKQFLELVAEDPALQSRLSMPGDPDALVAAGGERGLSFTSDELRSAIEAEMGEGDGELDESQLAHVAGGVSFRVAIGKLYALLGGGSGGDRGGQGTTGVRG